MFTGIAKVLQIRKGLESQEPIEKTHRSKPPWWLCSFARGHIHKPHDILPVKSMCWRYGLEGQHGYDELPTTGLRFSSRSQFTNDRSWGWTLDAFLHTCWSKDQWGMLGHVGTCLSYVHVSGRVFKDQWFLLVHICLQAFGNLNASNLVCHWMSGMVYMFMESHHVNCQYMLKGTRGHVVISKSRGTPSLNFKGAMTCTLPSDCSTATNAMAGCEGSYATLSLVEAHQDAT